MGGIGTAVASAMLFGTITGFAKLLLENAGPATVGALTYLGAGLVGLLAAAFLPSTSHPLSDKTENRAAFIAALLLGAIAAPLLLMTGLQWTAASQASILTNIEGIATAGLAWLLFKEKTDAISIGCILAILGGVACFTVSGEAVEGTSIGPLMVSAAYVCWALDINLMRRVSSGKAVKATAIRGIAGAIVMAGVAWLRQETFPDAAVLAGGVLAGAVGFGISFILLLRALPLIGAAKAGAISACAPIFSYLCNCAIEGALQPSPLQLLAIVLIVSGVLLSGISAFVSKQSESAKDFI